MTTKTTSPKFNGSTSKNDELAALREFRAQFSDSTYMASFLSDAGIKFFERNVRDDFSPDFVNAIEYAQAETAKIAARVEIANREIAAQTDRADRFENKYQSAVETIAAIKADQLEKDAEISRIRYQAIENANEYRTERERANELIADRDAEIIRLKAMIFDLEHAKK